MKKQLVIVVLIFVCNLPAFCQDSAFYYRYDFQSYIKSKISKPLEYIERVQSKTKYSAIARENQIEGRLECVLINHGSNLSEIFVRKKGLQSAIEGFYSNKLPYTLFEQEIQKAFTLIDSEMLLNNQEKFITEFTILFELDPSDTFTEKDKTGIDLFVKANMVKISTRRSH